MPITKNIIYQGALAPEAVVMTVAQGESGADLSTVTDAEIDVYSSGSVVNTWSAVISSQTTESLTLTYQFQEGDTDTTGPFTLLAKLTVPAGVFRCDPVNIYIQSIG